MHKLIIVLALFLSTSSCSFAAQLPDSVKGLVKGTFPETNFRFDGVIILPDNTIYLPIAYPNPNVLQYHLSSYIEDKRWLHFPPILGKKVLDDCLNNNDLIQFE